MAVCPALPVPRVCGGTDDIIKINMPRVGLSPRVRGNLGARGPARGPRRSIPACAGEPSTASRAAPLTAVYPRVCGGTRRGRYVRWCDDGLSPRVRGNHRCARRHKEVRGSIPACAGEPHRCLRTDLPTWVYPRVCGGTDPAGSQLFRSIPACAGEPGVGLPVLDIDKVYPRVCGGTTVADRQNRIAQGPRVRGNRGSLSPRVRGNLSYGPVTQYHFRSIPACAGEPLTG